MNQAALAGTVVVVAGASRGIGLATARAFAERDAAVVMLARGRERLLQEAAAIGEHALPVQADITDPDSVRVAFAEVEKRFGRLDVLVNNAGAARVRLLEECSDEDVELHVGTNFLGPIWCTRSAIPLLRRSEAADIVNICSESIHDPFPLLSLYAAAKGGLATFSKAMTRELRPSGIRVTLFICGATTTEFGSEWTQEEVTRGYAAWREQGYLANVSGEEYMDPADVADAILYAVSRPRSQMVDLIQVRAQR
jgi:NAD(P)-dependent dehydrogenase (short-subunit alcohol dehydrogenase family)